MACGSRSSCRTAGPSIPCSSSRASRSMGASCRRCWPTTRNSPPRPWASTWSASPNAPWPGYNRAIMKSFRKELAFEIRQRREFINIPPQVEQALAESGIREGLALVNAMHITASVFINDDEGGLHQDFESWLEGLAPAQPYSRDRHNGYADN